MIGLEHVTKRFGQVEAVSDLSLHVPGGMIVGLLGQNGAGKTTTLNMLTGYYPPTSGRVLIDGMDMLLQPRECKRRIGYLPEQPPLYDEMTVREYLRFCCALKEVVRRDVRRHVEEIIGLCGLGEMAERTLGRLSRGYRQRAGIAQALCGDPPVLVLDEPTVGLDPKQVVEIRALIGEIGKTHTVLFSSHLLGEVQQLCRRVVILNRGRLCYQGDLSARGDRMTLRARIAGSGKALLTSVRDLPCVEDAQLLGRDGAGACEIRIRCREQAPSPQEALFRLLCRLDMPLLSLREERDSLEEIFLRVTSGDEHNA